ncbi:tryptophan synthase subunit alpha [Companilactobacillus allii]|uniref:Tryptophan synthase alpha chain n=1 Tax=Companilactobacillus allii TaxID=1847728 RepID=A0A1P8Q3D2_9LACO|nr:tryptophan synthase subunit alpha [Companilactobacillus allii]APX72348.1 tryptophan synthase subunit alpha [Companilactobacillus allii]USQ69440.1 tryptophan synthase subunit alpha [Companilactobacillus allii]
MNKLEEVFKNKKAFIPFVVADDPNFDETVANVLTLADNGADIIELGIPFSDPVADGPIIQKADLRAFSAGVNTDVVFDIVEKIRESTQVPIIFLTYTNIVYKYGYENFCRKCSELNISGLVIPDLPLEEQDELREISDSYDISLIQLIAPTSGKRVAKIASQAKGFIYMVSSIGVTGKREDFSNELGSTIEEIRKVTNVPIAIGFGIHSVQQAKDLSQIADGIIIGSAVVEVINKGENLAKYSQLISSAI